MSEKYYTLEKVAKILQTTPEEVNRLRESGKLHGERDGTSWKFEKEPINIYLVEIISNPDKPLGYVRVTGGSNMSGSIHNSVVNDPVLERYIATEAETEARIKAIPPGELKAKIDAVLPPDDPENGGLGSCHLYWTVMQSILKEDYGIDWMTPSERHPDWDID